LALIGYGWRRAHPSMAAAAITRAMGRTGRAGLGKLWRHGTIGFGAGWSTPDLSLPSFGTSWIRYRLRVMPACSGNAPIDRCIGDVIEHRRSERAPPAHPLSAACRLASRKAGKGPPFASGSGREAAGAEKRLADTPTTSGFEMPWRASCPRGPPQLAGGPCGGVCAPDRIQVGRRRSDQSELFP
jgi:hypothetical protein